MAGFKWIRTYHAAAATPLDARPDRRWASALWQATKALITGTGVAVALLLFDETRTTGLPLAVLFAGLTGAAFAAPITAWAATRRAGTLVPVDQPLRDHAALPVRRRVLPDRSAARRGCSGSPRPRRSGMASSCAATPSTHRLRARQHRRCTSATCWCSSWAAG